MAKKKKKKPLTKRDITTIAEGLAELHEANTTVLNEDPLLEPVLRAYFYAGAALALGNMLEIKNVSPAAAEKLLKDMETEVCDFVREFKRDQAARN